MSITVTELQSHLDAARTAIGASNWDTAETELMQAQAVLSGLPDSQQDNQSVTWRQTINSLLRDVRRRRSQALGVSGLQGLPIAYERASKDQR